MSVEVKCSNPLCGESQRVPESALGLSARCRQCGQEFAVATHSAAAGAARAETITDASSAAAQKRGHQAASAAGQVRNPRGGWAAACRWARRDFRFERASHSPSAHGHRPNATDAFRPL